LPDARNPARNSMLAKVALALVTPQIREAARAMTKDESESAASYVICLTFCALGSH